MRVKAIKNPYSAGNRGFLKEKNTKHIVSIHAHSPSWNDKMNISAFQKKAQEKKEK